MPLPSANETNFQKSCKKATAPIGRSKHCIFSCPRPKSLTEFYISLKIKKTLSNSTPRDLWLLRRVIRVMRRHDPTNDKDNNNKYKYNDWDKYTFYFLLDSRLDPCNTSNVSMSSSPFRLWELFWEIFFWMSDSDPGCGVEPLCIDLWFLIPFFLLAIFPQLLWCQISASPQ